MIVAKLRSTMQSGEVQARNIARGLQRNTSVTAIDVVVCRRMDQRERQRTKEQREAGARCESGALTRFPLQGVGLQFDAAFAV